MIEINLFNMDCVEKLKEMPDKSVDLVCMDPPYNIKKSKEWDSWKKKEKYVEFMTEIFKECDRVLKDNGSMYFFHNDIEQITMLMNSIRQNTSFIYNSFIIWYKENYRKLAWCCTNIENNVLRSWFNICEYCLYYVKGKGKDRSGWEQTRLDVNNFKPIRQYARELFEYIGKDRKCTKTSMYKELGHHKVSHFMQYNATQFLLPTEETYNELIEKFNIDKWDKFKEYKVLINEYEEMRKEYKEQIKEKENERFVHNLDKDHNNVWKTNETNTGKLHPCQKPIDLLERIIKCSTNEGATVLDPFMGSGSTGLACKNLNRNFIGIERNKEYFEIAQKRINGEIK